MDRLAAGGGALILAGDVDRAELVTGEAERVARGIADTSTRDWALDLVAAKLAGADPGRAERIAGTIHDPEARGSALGSVVGALVAAGRLDRAERLVDLIGQPSDRAAASSAVAAALASAGDHARARTMAARAEPGAHLPYGQSVHAAVLCRPAATFAATGDPGRARSLLAAALGSAEWGRLPLSDIGALAPEVLTSLADCAEREGPGRDDRDLPGGPTPSA